MRKKWKIGIVRDFGKPCLEGHGLHTAFPGLPGVEIAAIADSNPETRRIQKELTGALREHAGMEEMLVRKEPVPIGLKEKRP